MRDPAQRPPTRVPSWRVLCLALGMAPLQASCAEPGAGSRNAPRNGPAASTSGDTIPAEAGDARPSGGAVGSVDNASAASGDAAAPGTDEASTPGPGKTSGPGSGDAPDPASGAAPDPDPCDPAALELSHPRGTVLQASGLTLRWRAAGAGPFDVMVLEDDEPVYTATTYGHELRVMVSRGEGTLGGPHDPELRTGRAYRWRVVPPFVEDPSRCPTAEFRLPTEEESRRAQARFEAEAERLGVGDEAREPEGEIALARLYLAEGFYGEAEGELKRLHQRGWDDARIEELLRELYVETGRRLSLESLAEPAAEPAPAAPGAS